VAKLEEQKPTYSLAHIVRERYPTFIDSLRDLDDALCLIILFSTLPSDDHVVTARVANCERLMKEFLTYVMRKRCLQKMFLSIKGIYYQAEILGQKITWIAPYRFKQTVPADVDVRVMLTFLEFYEVLLHFTNYKLFHSEGLQYPPNVDEVWQNNAQALALAKGDEDEVDLEAEAALEDVPEASMDGKPLLGDCFFFISRECPVESLHFVIKAFGGKCCYEGDKSGYDVDSKEITHHVVDRPVPANKPNPYMVKGREYIQPQWIYDSCNNGLLLPAFEYLPGKELPSHLSPFVDDDAEGYIPKRKEYLQRVRGEAMETEEGVEGESEDDEEEEDEEEDDALMGEEDEGEEEEEEEEDENEEISGDEKADPTPIKKKIAKKTKMQKAEEDQKSLASGLMTRRTRKMYTHVKRAENKKQAGVEELKRKRKEAESKTDKKTKSSVKKK
jgi:pescadillo